MSQHIMTFTVDGQELRFVFKTPGSWTLTASTDEGRAIVQNSRWAPHGLGDRLTLIRVRITADGIISETILPSTHCNITSQHGNELYYHFSDSPSAIYVKRPKDVGSNNPTIRRFGEPQILTELANDSMTAMLVEHLTDVRHGLLDIRSIGMVVGKLAGPHQLAFSTDLGEIYTIDELVQSKEERLVRFLEVHRGLNDGVHTSA